MAMILPVADNSRERQVHQDVYTALIVEVLKRTEWDQSDFDGVAEDAALACAAYQASAGELFD